MQYLAVCTFELRPASGSDYDRAYSALRGLGFEHGAPAKHAGSLDLPADAVVGAFDVTAPGCRSEIAFLRNCLSLKLREVFERHGLDAEFLLVVSQGDLAWERAGFAPADFAARHARGSMAARAAV